MIFYGLSLTNFTPIIEEIKIVYASFLFDFIFRTDHF